MRRNESATPHWVRVSITPCAFALLLAAAGCSTSTQTAGQALQSAPTIKVKPPLKLCKPIDVPPTEITSKSGYVQYAVDVTDTSGNPIAGLKQADFEVSSSGKVPPIEFFRENRNGTPTSIALAVDASGSMQQKLGMNDQPKLRAVWNALAGVMEQLNKCDEVAALEFGGEPPLSSVAVRAPPSSPAASGASTSQVRLVEPLTTDHELALVRLTYLVPYGQTPLYDAIHEGLQTLAGAHYPYRALIIITDGMDTSSKRSKEEVFAEAVRSGLPIYAIGLGDPDAPEVSVNVFGLPLGGGDIERVDEKTLRDFSGATGGQTFIVSPIATDIGGAFIGALEKITKTLNHSYSLGFVMPVGSEDEKPTITVRDHPDAIVSAHHIAISATAALAE